MCFNYCLNIQPNPWVAKWGCEQYKNYICDAVTMTLSTRHIEKKTIANIKM